MCKDWNEVKHERSIGSAERAKQEAEPRPRDWSWVETTIWTERMLAALDNGVKGSKWFSLIDKVARTDTLRLAWEKVARNRGAAGWTGKAWRSLPRKPRPTWKNWNKP